MKTKILLMTPLKELHINRNWNAKIEFVPY